MSRIRKGYEARFRSCLEQTGARRVEQGIVWLVKKAQRLSQTRHIPLHAAFGLVSESLAAKTPRPREASAPPLRFFCDAGLGGLARWLRAAGYEASWEPAIADELVLREARRLKATILTTDSLMMERRLLRDRTIPAFWLPPTLRIAEQLALVFRQFNLRAGQPRCMTCGGELRHQTKESLRERIPPRTYRWLDEYFVCSRCGKLFWHGTHWERIEKALERLEKPG